MVDLDLEKFFDRVNHDKMMSLVRERITDRGVRRLIRRYLQAGMLTGDVYMPRSEGTPQGGHSHHYWQTCCSINWTGNWRDVGTTSCGTPTM